MVKLYGSVKRLPGKFVIEAEPHVLMVLRRVFPRVLQERGEIIIQDTEEVCSLLLWFMDRYPLSVDDLFYVEQRAEVYEKRVEYFEAVLSGKIKPRRFDLATPARDYQLVAADLWLKQRNLLLADSMGLGKTCSAICGLVDPSTRPALVVTLTHLPAQWQKEINRFAPQLKTHIISKGTPYDIVNHGNRKAKKRIGKNIDFSSDENFPDVLIVNYHKLSGWAETLSGVIRSVIYDEVQELRHDGTAKYNGAKFISSKSDYNLALSGTPIYNYGIEMFNVLDVINPGAVGSRKEYINEWCYDAGGLSGNKILINNPAAFGTYLRDQGIMLRRTPKDVGRELPKSSNIVHTVECNHKELDKVSDRVAELANIIMSGSEVKGFDKMRAAEEISWKLRQATGIAKASYVADLVEMLLYEEKKIVVFAWHREVYSILMDRLAAHKPVMFTGSESNKQKEQAKQEFCEGASRVFLMSLRSGAGLDGLQFATNTGVFAELDWSPGVHEQCSTRISRDGQTNPVMMYYPVTDYGSDPVILETLGVKADQCDGVINPDNESVIEKAQVDPDKIKKLAQNYLSQRKGV